MADGVGRSPSRLCSRDGKICCDGDALSIIFLLLCLAPYLSFFVFFSSFLFFFSLHPGMFVFFFIRLVFFPVALISLGGVFFVVLSYPVR